jgi:DNA replication protein DnaC
MITSQRPVDRWHEIIGDPTYADAILDWLVHNAYRIELAGPRRFEIGTVGEIIRNLGETGSE